ncbi:MULTISPECIES: hypothetical protein [unclassified Streptomyces]|uniref:hypothetical protein n=1 Tax=unclassified Streptomyces TaxID=2593676 RepID=UPI0033E3DFAC
MISDQAGNTNSAQGTFVATKSSVSAVRKPSAVSHRGSTARRCPITDMEQVKTAAIRIANPTIKVYAKWRPKSQVGGAGRPPGRLVVASTASAAAAAANIVATKTSPLPRKTVARNLSSASPMCARITPMNQRKKMPANGTSASAARTALRRVGSGNPPPVAASAPCGMPSRISTMAAASSNAKTTPARPAARGVSSASAPLSSYAAHSSPGPWHQQAAVEGAPPPGAAERQSVMPPRPLCVREERRAGGAVCRRSDVREG